MVLHIQGLSHRFNKQNLCNRPSGCWRPQAHTLLPHVVLIFHRNDHKYIMEKLRLYFGTVKPANKERAQNKASSPKHLDLVWHSKIYLWAKTTSLQTPLFGWIEGPISSQVLLYQYAMPPILKDQPTKRPTNWLTDQLTNQLTDRPTKQASKQPTNLSLKHSLFQHGTGMPVPSETTTTLVFPSLIYLRICLYQTI